MELIAVAVFVYILAIALALLAPSPTDIKGKIGESRVAGKIRNNLPSNDYCLINDVILRIDGKTTQIDHVLISRFGIFCIETKNYKGYIYGSPQTKLWTQNIYGKKFEFQNPLRQNYLHQLALEQNFAIEAGQIHPIVVFTGDCSLFCDNMEGIVTLDGLIDHILRFKTECISAQSTDNIITSLNSIRAAQSSADQAQHSRQLRENLSALRRQESVGALSDTHSGAPEAYSPPPTCPNCQEIMVLRKARRGKNNGNNFWGCKQYPRCRGTRNFVK